MKRARAIGWSDVAARDGDIVLARQCAAGDEGPHAGSWSMPTSRWSMPLAISSWDATVKPSICPRTCFSGSFGRSVAFRVGPRCGPGSIGSSSTVLAIAAGGFIGIAAPPSYNSLRMSRSMASRRPQLARRHRSVRWTARSAGNECGVRSPGFPCSSAQPSSLKSYMDCDTQRLPTSLGVTKSAVKSRLTRAREALRQELKTP